MDQSAFCRNTITAKDGLLVNLALQGGGSHGAFTWGVLDRLLEDGRLAFPAISGTSAGAVNAVALAHGWAENGREGARQKLHDVWRRVGLKGRFSPIQRNPWDRAWGNWSVENTVGFNWLEALSRTVSPNMANPFNHNPLKEVVDAEIDFDLIQRKCAIDLFIAATNVETGQLRLFINDELDSRVIAASTCLPTLFPAVEINGQYYWDGGYGGNPALFPLRDANDHPDLLLIQINPIVRQGVPQTARSIQNRVDEITFNATLLRELRDIAMFRGLIAEGKLDPSAVKLQRFHRIDGDSHLDELGASSKVSAEWEFLTHMRDLGRAAADDWMTGCLDRVGREETFDLPGLTEDGRLLQPYRHKQVKTMLMDRIRGLVSR
ncbi:patatin [Notoacmeibacter marinus]|uniref:Patatin n=1 Tax=Notoacmeibacter marinus TaxID=1876515 RepID=A0A231V4L5_9HYPH|nr:patatin-like phospholipase family protein [Notoacmeibacter marinus]OXT02536.1 patatin [Notoacmeibacter marinus]